MSIHVRRDRVTALTCALALAAAASLPWAAAAQDIATSTTTGSTSISTPASLTVSQNLAFSIVPSTLTTGLTITSASVNGLNANFSLAGAQATSISVPSAFDGTRVGGTESVTVRTLAPIGDVTGGSQVSGVANGSLFNQPVTVVGALDSTQMSFSVGGAVTASNTLKPGEYHGVLTVVAQYN